MRLREHRVMRDLEDHHWWYGVLHSMAARALASRLPATARVLDAGCGTGGMLAALRRRRPLWRCEGVDLSAVAVEFCRERGLDEVRAGDVHALPFGDEVFDAVLSLDVLSHAGVDEVGALDEMRRVLRPGGVLVVNVAAFPSLRGGHDEAVESVRRYRRAGLVPLMEGRGLEVEAAHYWNAWLFLPLLVWRWWSRSKAVESRSAGSDLAPLPWILNGMLRAGGWLDAVICRAWTVPFGSSVWVVARRRMRGVGR